jgi:hypothetical protein
VNAAEDTTCAAVKTLLEPTACAIRATAQAFTSEKQVQELLAIVEAGDKVYHSIYAGMHKQVRCCCCCCCCACCVLMLLHASSSC